MKNHDLRLMDGSPNCYLTLWLNIPLLNNIKQSLDSDFIEMIDFWTKKAEDHIEIDFASFDGNCNEKDDDENYY